MKLQATELRTVRLGHAARGRADESWSSGSHEALGRRPTVERGLRPKVRCGEEAPGPAAACGHS